MNPDIQYNPYHFVPVVTRTKKQKQGHDLPLESLKTPASTTADVRMQAVTHERYVPDTHSGRITCCLRTVTPLVVGASRTVGTPQAAAKVEPYMVQAPGRTARQPAIPGSSLRGLLSSLAEAASNSALRVLEPGVYSYRKRMDQALSAIGMIERDGKGLLALRPLALPTLRVDDNNRLIRVPPKFGRIFPTPAFKVYLGDYYSIREDTFAYRTSSAPAEIPQPGELIVQGHKHVVIPVVYTGPNGSRIANSNNFRFHYRRGRVLAQRTQPGDAGSLGYYRVLGCWGDRKDTMPNTKTHELWVPQAAQGTQLCPIAPFAIERFNQLADERTEASKKHSPLLPFAPLDTRPERATTKENLRLQVGDIVYFDVDDRGTVTELSFSSIWRDRVTIDQSGVGAPDFFHRVDRNLLPLSPKRINSSPDASTPLGLTIAERLFGVVEERSTSDQAAAGTTRRQDKEQGRALAGRIRISDALPESVVVDERTLLDPEVTLRILSSPKPPSPALYFKGANGSEQYVAKSGLKPSAYHPQGRKMYLHHKVQAGSKPWETRHTTGENARLDQKACVRPIKQGQKFTFHIDYDNLTNAELGLLLYALAPNPDGTFHHKLGMGKPLGLGTVKITIDEHCQVDRQRRYSLDGLRDDKRYLVKTQPLTQTAKGVSDPFWALRDVLIGQLVSQEIHDALCLLGDFAKAPNSELVHTPTMQGQDIETETFEWFVGNDGGKNDKEVSSEPHQALTPLPKAKGQLPPLKQPIWQPQ